MKKRAYIFGFVAAGLVILALFAIQTEGGKGWSSLATAIFLAYCALIVVGQGVELLTTARKHFQQSQLEKKQREGITS
ncbi:MAG: hypothetical protein P8X63_07870 [Desulfuromonadaceae bacterium]